MSTYLLLVYILNTIYYLNNHIKHPSSQCNHPGKFLVASILHLITWFPHKIAMYMHPWELLCRHTIHWRHYQSNHNPNTTHTHSAHHTIQISKTTLINLAEIIRNLQTYIKKEHNKLTIDKAKPLQCASKWISNSSYSSYSKWISNDQIHHTIKLLMKNTTNYWCPNNTKS